MTPEEKIYNDIVDIHQILGALGTLGEYDQPQVTSVYFVFDTALNLYFITRETSRKYKNIKKHPRVAFAVSSEHPLRTVQLEGEAHEVTDAQEENEYFSKLVALSSEKTVMPPVSQIEEGRIVFMKITTDWARSGNFETLKEGDKFVESALI